jgi:2-phospho-L-lactate guanylyltransferase
MPLTVVAVPARDFATAKRRLAPVLTPSERLALARAMLEDVLSEVCQASVELIYVVTGDLEVAAAVRSFPVSVLHEPSPTGHSEAVALAQIEARGADVFVTVPADVPCITAREVQTLLAAAGGERAAVFVPSVSGYGTNAVLLKPPGLMSLKFGEPSFENHLTAARRHELTPVVLSLPGVALDIDGPDDLRALVQTDGDTRSGRLLARWGMRERLARRA